MRLLIFDFDGTLADTGKAILLTLSQTLARLDQKPPSQEELRSYIGMPLAKIFENACHSHDVELIASAVHLYRRDFPANCKDNIRLYPGVKESLGRLRQEGKILAIASSREKNSLLSLINQLGIFSDFSIICGEQDVARHKPEPDLADFILEKCGLAAKNAMFIGDTVFDIQCGKAAHMLTCGVSYGNHNREELLKAGADYIIDKFPELMDIVNKKG